MAKIKLTGGFKTIAEGTYKFRVKTVEFKADFGKLHMILENKDGETLFNDYNFGATGENEKAINAFSFFARAVLGNASLEEVDPDDLVGKYVMGTVTHSKVGDKTYANGKDWESCEGWEDNLPTDLDSILDI